MLAELYELLTGRRWRTTRSCVAEFGPPPGALYAEALRHYTDAELIVHGEAILADLREQEAAVGRLIELAQQLHGRPEPEITRTLAAAGGTGRVGDQR
ncbi:MAG: hypothetical protein ACRDT2_07730 [Natronosporangium sp.]